MLTRINPKKVFDDTGKAVTEIQSAIEGDWGRESQKGLRVVYLGKCTLMSGLFGADATAVEVPTTQERYPAYFHDTKGHSRMAVVEPGSRFVKKPEGISGGFAFFAMV